MANDAAWQAGVDIGNKALDKGNQKARSGAILAGAKKPSGLSTTVPSITAMIPSMKRGGRVKRTGLIYAHKGEFVIPAKRSGRKVSRTKTVIKA